MVTSFDIFPQPYSKRHTLLDAFLDKHVSALPTPSYVIKKSAIESNCAKMIQRAVDLGIRLRCHVKTVKTYPGLRNQLGYDLPNELPKQDRVLVSTLTEAWQIIHEQKERGETIVNDLLFGLPAITDEYLVQLYEISKHVKNFRVMVDDLQHLENLKSFNIKNGIDYKWSAFVKIDAGTNRAGILVENDTPLTNFLERLFSEDISPYVGLFGFYCHAGHSYASDTIGKAELALLDEISHVSKAIDVLKKFDPNYLADNTVTTSVGATPTIHSFDKFLYGKEKSDIDAKLASKIESLKSQNILLEIHAGNYPLCDLQQLATGCIEEPSIASYVLSTVISQYPGRRNEIGEMLISTGVISMSKEVSTFKGYGGVRYVGEDYGGWYIDRLSQEHGILSPLSPESKLIPIGTKVKVLPQHSCITINGFSHLFIVDDEQKVVDVWIPWRGY